MRPLQSERQIARESYASPGGTNNVRLVSRREQRTSDADVRDHRTRFAAFFLIDFWRDVLYLFYSLFRLFRQPFPCPYAAGGCDLKIASGG
jgi:hypothetical protein